MTAYVVLSTMFGAAGHAAGEVVTFTEDHVKKVGIDVERLIKNGTLREATSEEAKSAVTYGVTADAETPIFPAVPFQPTAPAPDPQRSENPPTNPTPGVNPDPVPVGGKVSDKPKLAKN